MESLSSVLRAAGELRARLWRALWGKGIAPSCCVLCAVWPATVCTAPSKGGPHAGLGTTTTCFPGCGAQTASSTVWLPSAALPGCLLEVPLVVQWGGTGRNSTVHWMCTRCAGVPCWLSPSVHYCRGVGVVVSTGGGSLAVSPADLPLHTVTRDVRCC